MAYKLKNKKLYDLTSKKSTAYKEKRLLEKKGYNVEIKKANYRNNKLKYGIYVE